MAVITRILAAASVLSVALVSTAPAAVGAVSVDHRLSNRNAHVQHADVVKRAAVTTKNGKRCKPRSAPASSKPVASSTKAPAPAKTPAPPKNNQGSPSKGENDGGNNGGKVGPPSKKRWLTWSNEHQEKLGEFVSDNIGGYVNWSPNPLSLAEKSFKQIEFAPMLWGQKSVSAFRETRSKYDYLVGMNEVNLGSQSGMSVGEGVALWNKEMRPMCQQGKYCVAPSVTTAPDGIDWLEGFFNQCGGDKSEKCGVSALNIHYYGKEASDLIDYANKLHSQFGLNVWITEFSCQSFGGPDQGSCSQSQANDYLNGVMAWADSTSWVHMYSAYGFMSDLGNVGQVNALMNDRGDPTNLGKNYIYN